MKYLKTLVFLTLFAALGAEAQVQSRLDFGMLPVSATRTREMLLTNYNSTVLRGISHTIAGDSFSVQSDCPEQLRSGLSCRYRITFWCQREGYAVGTLNIFTSDKNHQVHLSGVCNRINTPEPRPPTPRP
ncbi:hypothetical protein EZJ49_02215 [Bdellovibrio bacteriovorus]|uniref:hypothetical protein n=1 Tax=Bdellovibrio bacteriovorus TaxID=959 RepID=UPI0021CEB714|nr:hypothetical protein [Bdellovibrio bacteriovorus]UXR65063.1 hypothetical protein EZJ49_02215 [Bdellovibrio bacteriovorus]